MTTEADWRVERVALDAERVRRLLARLEPGAVTRLGDGWDSEAFRVETPRGPWVARFPKRAEVAARFAREQAVCRALAPLVAVEIPAIEVLGEPCEAFPLRWVGHPLIEGVEAGTFAPEACDLEAIGAELGRLLSALHGLTPGAWGLEVEDGRPTHWVEGARRRLGQLAGSLPEAPVAAGLAEIERLGGLAPAQTQVVIHEDLYFAHMLLDEAGARLRGVIDWTDVGLGDPAIDFGGIYSWGGERLVEAALTTYTGPADPELFARARLFGLCGASMDLFEGVKRDNPKAKRIGLRRFAALLATLAE